jgi:hypothetical protein
MQHIAGSAVGLLKAQPKEQKILGLGLQADAAGTFSGLTA